MNRNINTQRDEDWVVVYTTTDEWHARLAQTALLNERIRCKMYSSKRPDGTMQRVVTVMKSKQLDAMEIISRMEWALVADREARQRDYSGEPTPSEGDASTTEAQSIERLPQAVPTAVPRESIARREGIGEIIHYLEHGYELRVGPQPYYIIPEARWEEFVDFSAQRQEFAILLRGECTRLFKWLKEEKLMAEFIRLMESTYREVPPPRPPGTTGPQLLKRFVQWFSRVGHGVV